MNMEDLPLVSIITPSYNQGKYIEDTILSVKNQDYPRIEHIIFDGGSQDETIDILKKYETQYNLIWTSEPDEGQSDAVNKGFNLAKGDIIGWLNSDDVYIYTNSVSQIVNEFKARNDTDVIYGDALIIDKDNYVVRTFRSLDWNYRRLLIVNFITQPALFFRKHVIKDNKINAALQFSMDGDFWIRLGGKYCFYHYNKILSGDRFHPQIKRMNLDTRGIYHSESLATRENVGVKINNFYIFKHYIFSIYLSMYRRLIGLPDVFTIKKSGNFTIELNFKGVFVRFMYQVFPFDEVKDLFRRFNHSIFNRKKSSE